PAPRLHRIAFALYVALSGMFAILGFAVALWGKGVGVVERPMDRLAVELLGYNSPRYLPDQDKSFQADLALQDAEDERALGRFAHAVVAYRRVLQLRPDDEAAKQGLIRAYARLGDCASAKSAGG